MVIKMELIFNIKFKLNDAIIAKEEFKLQNGDKEALKAALIVAVKKCRENLFVVVMKAIDEA